MTVVSILYGAHYQQEFTAINDVVTNSYLVYGHLKALACCATAVLATEYLMIQCD